jgi:exosortase
MTIPQPETVTRKSEPTFIRHAEMSMSRRHVTFILFSLSLCLLMAGTIRDVIGFSLDLDHKHASQILLVPFISGALIWWNRKVVFQGSRWSVPFALPIVFLGGMLLVAGKIVGARLGENDNLTLAASSLVILWLGGFLLFYGPCSFKAALFPLLFMFFAVPIPIAVLDGVIAVLQRGSAEVAFVLLRLTGTPVYHDGVILTLPGLVVEVAPQCSGIRSGITLFIVSLLAGHLLLSSWWKRSAFILATVPVLFLKNAVRIATLSLLAVHFDKGILDSQLHQEGGILFLMLGLLLLYPVLAMLVRSEMREKSQVNRTLSAVSLP